MTSSDNVPSRLRRLLDGYQGRWFIVGLALHFGMRELYVNAYRRLDVAVAPQDAQAQTPFLLSELHASGFALNSFFSSKDSFLLEAEALDCRVRFASWDRLKAYSEFPEHITIAMDLAAHPSNLVSLQGVDFAAPFSRETYSKLLGQWGSIRRLCFALHLRMFLAFWRIQSVVNWVPGFFREADELLNLMKAKISEFPRVPQSALNRFQSWDEHLGWDNQPNVRKLDKSDRSAASHLKTRNDAALFSTDWRGSRASRYGDSESHLSIYGDSYAMCRDVNDHETVAWHLASIRQLNVTNYGVGNYGLDQALLKLEQKYLSDPTPNVVLAVTSITMARCASVYRHYLEPGNVLAIKPRFLVQENGELELLRNPVSNKQQFRSLESKSHIFRKFDDHYLNWKKHRLDFLINSPVRGAARLLGTPGASPDFLRFEYESSFWRSHEELFLALISRLSKFAINHGFRAYFLLQHQRRSLNFAKRTRHELLPWSGAISRAASLNPNVTFLDELDLFIDVEDTELLYRGSHHSPLANRLIAQLLDFAIGE